ncbi:MAG: hypothetical protein EXS36_19910 [Pedosphaera sp.]|nr:hypothetical protein [Pedosphaera sp.]
MKSSHMAWLVLLFVSSCLTVEAQNYGAARRLAERAAGREVAPRPPAASAQAAPPLAVAKPVDKAKVAAEKEEAKQRLVAYQKDRAEQGSARSQYDVGLRYLTGDGVGQDVKVGREWLKKSAAQNNDDAVAKLKELDEADKAEKAEKEKAEKAKARGK